MLEWFSERAEAEAENLAGLYEALETGGAETITGYLNRQLIPAVSFYDTKGPFYHGFLLALLNACAQWQVSSNVETGNGRCDILVEREDGLLGFIVELKVVKERTQLDSVREAALQQIKDRDYPRPPPPLRRRGHPRLRHRLLRQALPLCMRTHSRANAPWQAVLRCGRASAPTASPSVKSAVPSLQRASAAADALSSFAIIVSCCFSLSHTNRSWMAVCGPFRRANRRPCFL